MNAAFSIALIWGAALIAPTILKCFPRAVGWILAAAPFAVCLWLIAGIGTDPGIESFAWFPSFGTEVGFHIDGLARLMGVLITGIGGFIVLYACAYLEAKPELRWFLPMLLSFMGAMLGVVLSDNLILLFVFWELTSITSYILIGYYHEEEASRKKALQALLVTGAGGLALLAGFVLLGFAADSWSVAEINAQGRVLLDDPLYPAIFILIALGCFTKSAQFPFQFWLPNAMAAPTPVSAFLHSATMVKAGVFLFARLSPSLAGSDLWFWTLVIGGGITFLLGAGQGLLQTDLKKILAYTTLSVLGLLTLLLGLDTPLAAKAAILFLVAHALYKASLFMVAGIVDHALHTREVTRLGGLAKVMPITTAAAGLAALSSAGIAPFIGFIGKETVYEAGLVLEMGTLGLVLAGVFVVGNALLLALGFKAGVHPFWSTAPKSSTVSSGRHGDEHADDHDHGDEHTHHGPHDPSPAFWLGPVVLGVLGIFFGLFAPFLAGPFVGPAIAAVTGDPTLVKVALWHGFNIPLALSVVTLVLGLSLYFARNRLWQWIEERVWSDAPVGTEAIYFRLLDGMMALAVWQTRFLQSGKLRNYLLYILAFTGIVLVWQFSTNRAYFIFPSPLPLELLPSGLSVAMMVAALVAIITNSRVATLLCLGVVGYGVALLFLYFGAPDLAITQISVETLTVVLFMLVVYRLPLFQRFSSRATVGSDILISVLAGGFITLLVLLSMGIELAPAISDRMALWSYAEAKGRNVVNVILVDFRALDTFGEITVLGIAAVGVTALLGLFSKRVKSKERP